MAAPIKNQIMVKCFLPDEISLGGIFVPDSAKKDSNRVTIVAVGKGTKKRPMKLKAGQIGYRVMDWGLPFEENGEKFYVMDADAIIAVEPDHLSFSFTEKGRDNIGTFYIKEVEQKN